ncbi:hypothetical protein GCM10007079_25160 [Nocardiopsis terrae]|uniref:Lipoprotein antigen n=1 Tax=Nocardiopsis terrae TaxID=372655 RepID=A0ABR9HFT6_9ACTN|nr:hypothetical protein [Nocardiopsis terrae]MBE1457878.1 hypothetical protein [Nocardiopsis terrae]GHC83762.1 hypothetical protein GCM10007079_25160 [Nocardiopsis terrae]
MQHRRLAPALLLAFAFAPAASACSVPGTGEGGTAARGEGAAAEETVGEEGAQEGGADRDDTGAVLGTVSVDGAEYEITEVRNCVPLEQVGIERELELQGFGDLDGETVQVDAYVQTIGGASMDSVSWSGPEGVFGSGQGAAGSGQEVALEVSGDQVTGSAVLGDALAGTETVSVELTLPVPDELVDCHV